LLGCLYNDSEGVDLLKTKIIKKSNEILLSYIYRAERTKLLHNKKFAMQASQKSKPFVVK